ncbi:uncharacterized protein STEHIDRAFT_142261 [Stereum hirsutum FP-91666 SS1]|uniref:uncharacterized protein n=1 Tax=Stereum hirsutum (strain FP-91666) TaxID=721885 RepID=UPI0004449434|nr:uncharacterized protein STEHIDRAFT_142261 [Stereum hirsutum FP-91666 SS1]EIM81721.1 hypothetical protein STEHIDRAFT_142261 [Stereum hirsutum FP-91666 SS1]
MTETPPETPQQPYTFVRIKRKRTDAPLDALLFGSDLSEPSRKKKLRPGVNVFQFASTVEEASWDDSTQKDLQERIDALARQPVDAPDKPIAPLPKRKRVTETPQPQYTIVAQPQEPASVSSSRRPIAPPKVLSAKELERAKSNVKVYDAVLAPSTVVLPTPVDPDFEVFNDLLQDYLQLNDITPVSAPLTSDKVTATERKKKKAPLPSSRVPSPTKALTARLEDQDPDPDYVWDVFFHRPGTLQDYANVGNVGTLTGLPASFGDPDESDAESEPEDEADEDSNDEGYYRNDYPDADTDEWSSNEGDGSDEWHEDSEVEDGEEHEWR